MARKNSQKLESSKLKIPSDGEAQRYPSKVWANTREIAEHTGHSISFYEKLRIRGEGPPFVRWGKSVRYHVETVDAFWRLHTVAS